jgi:GNAT superfamily N-acetyltransferase
MLIRLTDPDDPLAMACLAAYSAFLSQVVPEEGPNPIPVPLADAASFRAPHGAALVASDGRPLGCVLLRRLDATTAEVKRLYVMPEARGMGLARRLMTAIEDQARALGYDGLRLDTNRALTPAIALYEASGWAPIPAYTDYPATHWYAKRL